MSVKSPYLCVCIYIYLNKIVPKLPKFANSKWFGKYYFYQVSYYRWRRIQVFFYFEWEKHNNVYSIFTLLSYIFIYLKGYFSWRNLIKLVKLGKVKVESTSIYFNARISIWSIQKTTRITTLYTHIILTNHKYNKLITF